MDVWNQQKKLRWDVWNWQKKKKNTKNWMYEMGI
jgi:hypothetical protein